MRDWPLWLRRLVAPVAVLVLVLVASVRLFVLPAVDEPEDLRAAPVDAVVVLGGDGGERIAAATALARRLPDPPPTLLLSVPYEEPLLTCGTSDRVPDAEVLCRRPDPFTTAGEAVTFVELAVERGWRRMVVVTSDFHVTRSRALFSRCAETLAPDLELLYTVGETDSASLHGVWSIMTEWPSLLATPWDHAPACAGEPDV